MRHLVALWSALALLASAFAAAAEPQRVHHRENVLGTSFEMVVVGIDEREQEAVVNATLGEIQRLEKVLSGWQPESELSRVNGAESPVDLSGELAEVLSLCEDWRHRTSSAFSCRLGGLIRQWRALDGATELPDRTALRKTARALERLDVVVQRKSFVRPPQLRWDVDGIAKGYVLDKALAVARLRAPRASGIRIDIGGDAVYSGRGPQGKPWHVAVADPRGPRDNTGFLATLELSDAAGIASSGHRSRGVRVANRHFTHILDPLEGWPADYAPAATVVAKDAATADALATALSVLPIRKGLDLIERTPGAQALLVSETGKTFASSGWYGHLVPEDRHDPPWAPGFEFVVDYEILSAIRATIAGRISRSGSRRRAAASRYASCCCSANPSGGCRKCAHGGARLAASMNPPSTASCGRRVAPAFIRSRGMDATNAVAACPPANTSFASKPLASMANASCLSCRCAWEASASPCSNRDPGKWAE